MVGERLPHTSAETLKKESLRHGAQLTALRLQHDWSQADLNKESGLSQGYICQLETNPRRNPRHKAILALARALGTGINFWEGQVDERVFLRPEARLVNDMLQIPHVPDSSPIRALFAQYIAAAISEVPDPNLVYIDHFPKYERIGQKVNKLRTDLGLSQEEVADDTGLSQAYISQLESEAWQIESPLISVLNRLAPTLKTDIYGLLDLVTVDYPEPVVRVDRFFRSSHSLEQKRKVRAVITSRLDHLNDPVLNRPGQESAIPAQ